MAKKITQYPASGGNPDVGSLIDISELISGVYTSKKLTFQQLLDYLSTNLAIGGSTTTMYNNTGSTIPQGTPVEIGTGVNGLNPNLKVITGSETTNDGKIFIATTSILNGATGECIESGLIQFPSLFATGDKVFWNISTGTFTNVSTNDDQIFIGIIIFGANFTTGKMFVAPRFSPSLVKGVAGQIPLFLGERKINGNTNFTFVNNAGVEVGFRFSDSSNNLTQVGVTYTNMESEGIASNSVLRLANWADNSNKGIVSYRKSRGTKASPSKVLINDVLGTMIFTGQADKSIDGGAVISSGMTTGEIIIRALNNFIRNYDSFGYETFAQGLTQFEIWLQGSNQLTSGDATPPNIKVFSVNGDGKIYFKNYNFPITAGTNGQTLITDASGNLTWQTPTSSNPINPPTLGNSIPYYDGSVANFLSSLFTYDASNGELNYTASNTEYRFGRQWFNWFTNSTTGSQQSLNTGISLFLRNSSSLDCAVIRLGHGRGTNASGLYLLSGDSVGSIDFNSMGAVNGDMAKILAVANENGSITSQGTRLEFYTTANGTTSRVKRLTIGADGKIAFQNYTFPLADGAPNQYLSTNGAGVVSFVNDLSPITQDKWALPNSAQLRGQLYNPLVTTKISFGSDIGSETGTKTAKTPTAGSELSKKISCKLAVSTSSVNGNCGLRGTNLNYFRENGILFSCGFAQSDTGYNPSATMFVGLSYLTILATSYTAPATVGNSLWNSLSFVGVGSDGYSASFTGSCTGTTLTVSAITYGTLEVGQSFSTSTVGTKIVSQLTGTTGGIGTYQLSISQTITNSTMRAFDVNLCIMTNDASGNATKISLGDNFPANRLTGAVNTNNFYVFEMYSGIDANDISWRIRNTGIAGSVTEGILSTNVPPLGTPLNYCIYRNSMGDSNACSFDISHLYCSNLS